MLKSFYEYIIQVKTGIGTQKADLVFLHNQMHKDQVGIAIQKYIILINVTSTNKFS